MLCGNLGARIGLGGILYYNYDKKTPNPILIVNKALTLCIPRIGTSDPVGRPSLTNCRPAAESRASFGISLLGARRKWV